MDLKVNGPHDVAIFSTFWPFLSPVFQNFEFLYAHEIFRVGKPAIADMILNIKTKFQVIFSV